MKLLLLMLLLVIILPNLYIIPTVLYHQSHGECVMFVASGTTLDSCGKLSDPMYNILAMNGMFWAICIMLAIGNWVINLPGVSSKR